jgi:hypothetical protein
MISWGYKNCSSPWMYPLVALCHTNTIQVISCILLMKNIALWPNVAATSDSDFPSRLLKSFWTESSRVTSPNWCDLEVEASRLEPLGATWVDEKNEKYSLCDLNDTDSWKNGLGAHLLYTQFYFTAKVQFSEYSKFLLVLQSEPSPRDDQACPELSPSAEDIVWESGKFVRKQWDKSNLLTRICSTGNNKWIPQRSSQSKK